MEIQVLPTQESTQVQRQDVELQLTEVHLLQLAVIGGGCAEVCPY